MRIIEPKYIIEQCPNHEEALRQIEEAGRTCYKSEDKITEDSGGKFVEMVLEKGHESVIEHVSMTVRFICNRGVCYSADTDVLTDEGWKSWPDVRGDELFATLNEKNLVEYQSVTEVIRQDFDGDMYELRTSLINLCVTPEHNLFIQKHDTQAAKRKEEPWQLLPAQEIAGKRVKHKRNANPRADGVTTFSIPDFVTTQNNRYGNTNLHTRKGDTYNAAIFAKFLGYWLSEGSLDHSVGSSYQVTLYQNVGPVLDEILSVLREMGYDPSLKSNRGSKYNKRIAICDAALFQFLKPYHGAINKRIPRKVLREFSGNDLMELILRYVQGDGSVHYENGHMQAYTISKGMAGDLQEAALHAGISATTWIDDRVGKAGGIPSIINRHPCHVVSFVTAKNTPLVNHGAKTFKGQPHEAWVPYSGMVYCATVPNHVLYVRRNGRPCWSGNSHEMVRHRLAAYSQESTRYCNYSKGKHDNEITVINDNYEGEKLEVWLKVIETCEWGYMRLLKLGEKPQKARNLLPIALKTEIVMTANVREWRHVFRLRCSPRAHPQMQQLMIPLLNNVAKRLPKIFGGSFQDEVLEKKNA